MRAYEIKPQIFNETDRRYGNSTQRSRLIDIEQAKQLLVKNCSEMLQQMEQGFRIYRGLNNENPVLMFEPNNSVRVSRNTYNYVTLLVDNTESWAHMPKRSKSIICSNHHSVAASYGTIYMVIPYNGAKIGVCSESDFWFSLPRLTSNVASFNEILHRLIRAAQMDIKEVHTYQELREKLIALAETYCSGPEAFLLKVGDNYKSFISHLTQKGTNPNIMDTINYLISPEQNDILLRTTSDFNITDRREVWTEGPAVLLHKDYWPILDEIYALHGYELRFGNK